MDLLEDAKKMMNVKGLTYKTVTDHADIVDSISMGMLSRVTDQNGVNRQSSRSHSVLE